MPANGSNGSIEEVETSTAVVPAMQKIDSLATQRAPHLVLSEATKAAKALSKVIEGKPKKVVFNGKTYLQFEDWQTVGRFELQPNSSLPKSVSFQTRALKEQQCSI